MPQPKPGAHRSSSIPKVTLPITILGDRNPTTQALSHAFLEVLTQEESQHIIDTFLSNGYIITMEQAHYLWFWISHDYGAGCLALPSTQKSLWKEIYTHKPTRWQSYD
jgi:hypothetical protein